MYIQDKLVRVSELIRQKFYLQFYGNILRSKWEGYQLYQNFDYP